MEPADGCWRPTVVTRTRGAARLTAAVLVVASTVTGCTATGPEVIGAGPSVSSGHPSSAATTSASRPENAEHAGGRRSVCSPALADPSATERPSGSTGDRAANGRSPTPDGLRPTGGLHSPAQKQERVDSVAAALTALIIAHGETGLTGLSVGPAAVRVDLYWCGPIPPLLRRAAAHAGARVVFHSVPYSGQQLSGAVDEVMGAGPAGATPLTEQLQAMGVTVFSGGTSTDFTAAAFTVGIGGGHPVAATLSRAEQLIADTTLVRCILTAGPQAHAV